MKTKNLSYQKIRDSFFLATTIEGRSHHTLELYEYILASFERFLNDKNPLEAEAGNIRRYLLSLSEKGYKKATIATHYKKLHAFYNFLSSEGIIEKNPLSLVKSPKLPRCYPYVLSEEEVVKLLRVARGKTFEDKRNYAMLLFFLDTGARVSEVTGLTLDDVSLATYTARVRGKGERERTVHFGKETAKTLSAYLRSRGVLPHEDTFFVSRRGEGLGRHAVLRMVKRLGGKAGIVGKRVSPHTLRHTSATFWVKNGGDPVSLQRQLGQSDPRMVDVYVNLVGRDLKEAHSKYSPLKRLLTLK